MTVNDNNNFGGQVQDEPTAPVESMEIDLSEMLAAEMEQLGKGLTVKLGPYTFTTLGQVPGYVVSKLATVQKNTDITVFVETVSLLFVEGDRERFKDFVAESGISIKAIAQIYRNVLERITGKNTAQQ